MQDKDIEDLRAAIAALEAQRATLGDAVLELAVAPLRARLAGLQRRQVTVLFADAVGSTANAQAADAEDRLQFLDATFQRMARCIEDHQGRVLRFTGDGIKAAFGMERAREDDAERAVRAGLAILNAGRELAGEALRLHGVADFALRVGVHTGDVVLGAGVEADNSAVGTAVNIAARMEQSAPPGALRISHDTWNQVRGLFDMEVQPPLQVKGIAAPLQTHLVRAALDRRHSGIERGVQGLSTPMVGRDAELQRLLGAVARARETRQLQAFTLVGDAGLGKSRLLRELVAGLQGCKVVMLRSQPDGMLRPWGLVRALLATQFDVADTDSAEVARHKVVEGLSPWFDEYGERRAQLIGQLSGLDFGDSPHVRGLDPRSLRDQAFAALRAWLQALATRGEVLPVLIVEDLHWADDGSLDLLQDWLAHAAELPLALIMSGRPELLTRRPDWAAAEAVVPLPALPEAQSDELLRALLQRMDEVPQALSELIVGRAEGNPYYMEELVRRLIDDGVIAVDGTHWRMQGERLQNLQLPGTLVGLLQARLDALPAHERLAARQASVIGHVFWDDALQSLDDKATRALPALERAAFVRAHEASDFEGTTERQFDHHLLHQVTYDTLLKAERVLGHGAAARWLAERTKGRGAEFLAMTGEHAERAGDTALAVDCFEQAGKEAQKRYSNAAATSLLRRAVVLLGESDPPRRFNLLHRLAVITDTVADREGQGRLHAEMAALLYRHPAEADRARLWFSESLLADRLGDFAAAGRLARQSFELAERCEAAHPAAMSQNELAYLKHLDRDHAGALEHVEIGLRWAARLEPGADNLRAVTEAQLMARSAQVSIALGRFAVARETLRAVLSRGEELASSMMQISALLHLATLAEYLGRWDEASACAQTIRELAQPAGLRAMVGKAFGILGRAAQGRDDHAAAVRWREQALEITRAVGDRYFEAFVMFTLGTSHLALQDAVKAQHWFGQSGAAFETLGLVHKVFEARASVGLCQAHLGDMGTALPEVEGVLAYVAANPSEDPGTHLDVRWTCQQVLASAGDARAAPMLDALFADVQFCAGELADAAELTDAADREQLIQAVPTFRAVAGAYRQRGEAPQPRPE